MSATADYDEGYYQGNDQSGDRIALRFYARVAARLAPNGASALDFGCGTGHFSRRLARRFRSIAYDPSRYARECTARVSPRSRVVADLEEIPAGSVDLACSLHVLEHVPEPITALRSLARAVRPGGRLLYVVPNPQGLGHRIRKQDWFAYRDPTHCSVLARDEWLLLTAEAGFRVEGVAGDGLWDPPYVPRVPRFLQLAVFGLPAAAQVALGRAVLPRDSGECIVVTARREP